MGIWAKDIRRYHNLSQKHSISNFEDLIRLQNSGTLSRSDISKIRLDLNLTPEERTQLTAAKIFESRQYSPTGIPLHQKVNLILDFCKTGQELTR